jgi:hypothetical protein
MELTRSRGSSWAFVVLAPIFAVTVIASCVLFVPVTMPSPMTGTNPNFSEPQSETEPTVAEVGGFGSLNPVEPAPVVNESGGFGSLSSDVAAAAVRKAPIATAPATKRPAPIVSASPAPQVRAAVVPPKAVKQNAVTPAPVAAPMAPAPVVKAPAAVPAPVTPKPVATPTPVAPVAAPSAARASKLAECKWNNVLIAEVENTYWCDFIFWDKFGKTPTWTVLTPRPVGPSLGSATSVERRADGRVSCVWNGRQVAISAQSSYCGMFFNDLDGLDASWH